MPFHTRLLPDMIILPNQPIPKTLVLNFDNTLITTEYKLGTGMINLKRPYLNKFLDELSELYEIVVFSSKEDSSVKNNK